MLSRDIRLRKKVYTFREIDKKPKCDPFMKTGTYLSFCIDWFFSVIRRLVSLITSQANLIVTNEVLVKQAQNAAAAAQAALERQNAGSTNSENDMKELRKKLDEKEKDLAKAIKDK